MSRTIDELDARISSSVEAVKQKVNPVHHARAHPWPAMLTALAAGVAIGATRLDRKAVKGAKQAPGATLALSRKAVHGAGELAKSTNERVRGGSGESPGDGCAEGNGLFGRVRSSVAKAVESQGRTLTLELERAARDLVTATVTSSRPRTNRVR